jgi:hypothetical protein
VDLLFEDLPGAHVAGDELPGALLVFAAVGVGVPGLDALELVVDGQFDQQEGLLDRDRAEGEVLVVAERLLIINM